jgi:hypothetical protein
MHEFPFVPYALLLFSFPNFCILDAAEIRKAAMGAIAGNVRVMLCMTGGSVVTMEDCEEYLARLPNVYKREVIRSFKAYRPLDLRHLAPDTAR